MSLTPWITCSQPSLSNTPLLLLLLLFLPDSQLWAPPLLPLRPTKLRFIPSAPSEFLHKPPSAALLFPSNSPRAASQVQASRPLAPPPLFPETSGVSWRAEPLGRHLLPPPSFLRRPGLPLRLPRSQEGAALRVAKALRSPKPAPGRRAPTSWPAPFGTLANRVPLDGPGNQSARSGERRERLAAAPGPPPAGRRLYAQAPPTRPRLQGKPGFWPPSSFFHLTVLTKVGARARFFRNLCNWTHGLKRIPPPTPSRYSSHPCLILQRGKWGPMKC